jgi:hypothetical protein
MMTNPARWRNFLVLGTAVLVCLSAPLQLGSTCGEKPARPKGYTFLDGHIAHPHITSAPVLLDFDAVRKAYGHRNQAQEDENIQEWQSRICQRASLEDIHALIYQSTLSDLEYLYAAAAGTYRNLDSYNRSNSFARYLARNKCTETIRYLAFAKRCEPFVVAGTDPWQKKPRDTAAMKRLIQEARGQFLSIQSDYIRLRYAYQMIRLAHYAKDYPQVLELYDYLMPKIDHDPSVVEYWIKGHLAGALLALGRNVEASYHYAQIFDRSRGKAETAFQSFRIKNDQEWQQCLLLCQSDRERAALYALRAASEESKVTEEMQHIYELDPGSPHLEILLLREMRNLEKDYLGWAFQNPRSAQQQELPRRRPDAARYLTSLQQFVKQCIAQKKVLRPELWIIAEGYLDFLGGNYYEAAKSFRYAAESVENDTLAAQLRIFKLALQINAWQRPTEEVESQAFQIKNDNPYFKAVPDFASYLENRLIQLYLEANQPGKAFLLRYPAKDLRANPELTLLEELIALCYKQNPTELEQKMIIKQDTTTILLDLLDLKATALWAEGKWEAAMETWKQIPEEKMDDFGRYAPFAERFNECVHCPTRELGGSYNKLELAQRLREMEYRANAGVSGADTLFYEMGLAWYNMSWFGHSWRALDFYRSGASLARKQRGVGSGFIMPHPYFPYGNREFMDCSKALDYFEKARMLAKSPEYAARATYMAAKCERNIQELAGIPTALRKRYYFDLLRTTYRNTDFYGRTTRECKYFAHYVAR